MVMIIQVISNGTCELYLLSYLLQLDRLINDKYDTIMAKETLIY